MHVADPAQLSAISHYSQDPRATSVPLAWANRFPITSGTAEEVIARRPTLVLAGPHVAPQTISALQRLNIRLVKLPVPDSIAASKTQIIEVSRLTGHADRGAALNARIDAAIAQSRATRATRHADALILQSGGLTPGPGTLADELLTLAGFRNAARRLTTKPWDVPTLEAIATAPPPLLLTDPTTADRRLNHPVLRSLPRAPFPSRLLQCGGPNIIPALAALKAARA
ncbi:ABC transporter substrate-binding protein [Sandaracinobacteroides saxicola]|uniref:ABC transporter substrate-binding protein n=2 Tax=Sandaracinobacteroides saxicola TaxID=2759707 RepID=A0A7G5IME7_9SPHN|nr:ABC transporter substrate-binding protein [Sandaracinobacteroides saxicola]